MLYADKTKIDMNLVYFIYSGNIIMNEELSFEEISNNEDKIRNKININVIEKNIISKEIIKPKEIICPKCNESIKMYIEDYNIFLYECKNGHEIDNISFDEFEKSQNINISKIKCEECKIINKKETYNNEFYICYKCKKNICPKCKTNHDKTHNIINYDNKNYLCEKHNQLYNLYCIKCKKNICIYCENEHNNHNIIYFKEEFQNIKELKRKSKELKEKIDKLKHNIKEIINLLNKTMKHIEYYYKISNEIINNFDNKRLNYEILNNIKIINNNNNIIIEDLNNIINDDNINNKFNKIFTIYDKISKKYIKRLNISYRINKGENIIKIFGTDFVKNNKDKCKLIIEGNYYELSEIFNLNNYNKIKDTLEITLKIFKNINNMSYMFSHCSSLSSLSSDISNWNISVVTNMSSMFYRCSLLSSLPDISKWNTNKVIKMNSIFSMCSSLLSLPDISKWDTSNVTDMSEMFYKCSSLSSLPDISKWNTSNVISMQTIFSDCLSLTFLPDISKWDTSHVTNMSYIFADCPSLSFFPNISKWNYNNINFIFYMFENNYNCLELPKINKSLNFW